MGKSPTERMGHTCAREGCGLGRWSAVADVENACGAAGMALDTARVASWQRRDSVPGMPIAVSTGPQIDRLAL